MKTRLLAAAFALLMGTMGASAATITFVESFEGNDCSGVLGQGFSNCKYDGSPIVAKVEVSKTVVNGLFFPDATAAMFSATTGSKSTTFSWDTVDILIRYIVVKFGPGFNVYAVNGGVGAVSGSGSISGFANGVSHVSFYDSKTTTPVIPLPAAGWLLLAGVGGLAAVRRRRKAA